MARINAAASEQHTQGSDAPRRKKGRKSHTPSVDLSQATKRAASPPAEPSQPKRKRVQLDDTQQLAIELEDSVSRSQSQAHNPDTIRAANEDSSRCSRRHSEPVVSAQDDEDDSQKTPPPSTQPLTGLTPHLDNIGAQRGRPSNARRARMSMPAQLRVEPVDDNIDNREFQFAPLSAVLDSRTRRRLRRSHLSQEVNEIEEHQKEDKKLRKAYTDLRRQLRDKDEAIADLEFQLEARRMGNIDMTDDRAEELEGQLAQARKEIDELRASTIYTGDSREQSAFEGNMDGMDDDDDGLMLIEPDELDGPQEFGDAEPLPNGHYASRALALSSQVTVNSLATMIQTSHDVLAEPSQSDPSSVPDKISDKAVKRFETEIDRLVQQLADSQGALRVIAIELQNLHVVQPGASSDVIITKLRHGFEAVREELNNLIPNCTVGLTNSELLHKIPELFEGVLTELKEKVVQSETHYQSEQTLRRQYEKVLDLLSRSEERNNALDDKVDGLERDNADKEDSIRELEDRVATLSDLADNQDAEIKQKAAQINGLQDQVDDKDTQVERLTTSIKTYRIDLDNLTKTTMAMEEEHQETIAKMEDEHTSQVLDLETQLADESEARKIAEGQGEQKSEYIDELEDKIKEFEDEITAINDDIAQLRRRLETETQNREAAEEDRDQQVEQVYTHSNTIENLEETIQDLETQLEDTKTNLQNERAERERTQAALDDAERQIVDLNSDIHDAGRQANELRSKLFEAQQAKEEAITKLEEDAQDREAELQDLLDVEIRARGDAEQQVTNLEDQVSQLENKVANLENSIAQMTQERDDLEQDRNECIATLNAQLAHLKQKYTALENSKNSEITTLQANITDLTNDVNAQKAQIERITEEAIAVKNDLRDQLAVKTNLVADLEDDLANAREENGKLVVENKSLAERLAEEAVHLLEIDDAHVRERDALMQVIQTHEATIQNLRDAATRRAAEHQEAIAEKTTEIEELRVSDNARAELIGELEAQIEEMKEAFRAAEEDTCNTIDTLNESQRVLQQQTENLATLLKQRNADKLKAVQEMKVKGVQIRTRGVDLHRVANGKVSKVSERVKVGKKVTKKGPKEKVPKRKFDSGIGVDENFEVDNIDEVGTEPVLG